MWRELSGMRARVDAVEASFADALAECVRSTWNELETDGLLHPAAQPPTLDPPRLFGEALACAIALEEGTSRAELWRQQYLHLLPAQRVVQLATRGAPNAALFHTRLDWNALHSIRSVVEGLFALAARCRCAGEVAFGAIDAASFLAARPTVGALYEGTFYGGLMPILYAGPGEMAAMRRALEAGNSLDRVIDRHLASPLLHELAHGQRDRAALWPPYLDECLAGYLGVVVRRAFAFPIAGSQEAIYATPWFAQVGQALARACGFERVVRAHFGGCAWEEALPSGLLQALAELGWREHVEKRPLHFLPSNTQPQPWMKLFFLAAAGERLDGWTLDALDRLEWQAIPTDAPSPLDDEILRDALWSMCLRNVQRDRSFHVEVAAPPYEVEIDLARCEVRTRRREHDLAAPSYLFPPAVAAQLRARGIGGYRVRMEAVEAIEDVLALVREGSGDRTGAGWAMERVGAAAELARVCMK